MAALDSAGLGARGTATPRIGILALALAVTCGLAIPSAAAAATPYEPNDSVPSAFGPLAIQQTYNAAIEYPGDRDFFYFYVTSPEEAPVGLEVTNLSGGVEISDIDATIIDTTSTITGSLSFVRKGESRPGMFSLVPQKYFLEISSKEGFGDAYRLTTSGGTGAFGGYAAITRRCSKATASVRKLQSGLSRAKQRLQRATSRLRRARYSTQGARQTARLDRRQAKDRVADKKDALRTARRAELPWCAIPQ